MDRGWAQETDGVWHPTEDGRDVREEGERETDRLFFGPWACLSEEDLDELHGLLTRMKASLDEMAEQQDMR